MQGSLSRFPRWTEQICFASTTHKNSLIGVHFPTTTSAQALVSPTAAASHTVATTSPTAAASPTVATTKCSRSSLLSPLLAAATSQTTTSLPASVSPTVATTRDSTGALSSPPATVAPLSGGALACTSTTSAHLLCPLGPRLHDCADDTDEVGAPHRRPNYSFFSLERRMEHHLRLVRSRKARVGWLKTADHGTAENIELWWIVVMCYGWEG